MRNLPVPLLSGVFLLLCSFSACIPVPMTTPELYRPLSYFSPEEDKLEFETRLAKFDLAIQVDATNVNARFARAVLLMGVGRYSSAEDELTAAIKAAKQQPEFSSARLASIYVHRGPAPLGRRAGRSGHRRLYPGHQTGTGRLGSLLSPLAGLPIPGKTEQAEQDRKRGLKLKPSVFEKEYVLRYDGIVL